MKSLVPGRNYNVTVYTTSANVLSKAVKLTSIINLSKSVCGRMFSIVCTFYFSLFLPIQQQNVMKRKVGGGDKFRLKPGPWL